MRVKVKERGYINHRIVEPGEVIEVPDGLVGSWFEPVDNAVVQSQRLDPVPEFNQLSLKKK